VHNWIVRYQQCYETCVKEEDKHGHQEICSINARIMFSAALDLTNPAAVAPHLILNPTIGAILCVGSKNSYFLVASRKLVSLNNYFLQCHAQRIHL